MAAVIASPVGLRRSPRREEGVIDSLLGELAGWLKAQGVDEGTARLVAWKVSQKTIAGIAFSPEETALCEAFLLRKGRGAGPGAAELAWLRQRLGDYGQGAVQEKWRPGGEVQQKWLPGGMVHEKWLPAGMVHEKWLPGGMVQEKWLPGAMVHEKWLPAGMVQEKWLPGARATPGPAGTGSPWPSLGLSPPASLIRQLAHSIVRQRS
ncbi:MAG: hypothetical protein ACM3JH_05355 [Acidithiobacillales bacterium]